VPSSLLAFLIARELGMKVDELFELRDDEPDPRDPLPAEDHGVEA
jgi:hypothetical protein